MNELRQQGRPSFHAISAALAWSMGAAWIALSWAGIAADRPEIFVARPFGLQRVLLVHLICALPLAWLLAGRGDLSRRLTRSTIWLVMVLLGAALSAATGAWESALATRIAATNQWTTLGVRTAWCVALEVPWLLWIAPRARPLGSRTRWRALGLWAAALAIALLLPAAFAVDLAQREALAAEQDWRSLRLWRAWRRVERLADLAAPATVAGMSPQQAQMALAREVEQAWRTIARPLAPEASPKTRLEYARAAAALEQYPVARNALSTADDDDWAARLLLAAVLEAEGDNQAGHRVLTELLARIESRDGAARPENRLWLVTAYDALAQNLRRQRRFIEAAECLQAALRQVPGAETHFHLQLGEHYRQAGRPFDARFHLSEVLAGDDPALARQARQALRDLDAATPSCFLGPAAPLSR